MQRGGGDTGSSSKASRVDLKLGSRQPPKLPENRLGLTVVLRPHPFSGASTQRALQLKIFRLKGRPVWSQGVKLALR